MTIKTLIKVGSAAAVLCLAGQAYAAAPADSTLRNTAELTYTGLATPIYASVDVTVSLTAAAPTMSAPVDITAAEGQSASVTYTITSNSNGSDTYNLSSSNTLNNVAGTSAATFSQGGGNITSVTLGASSALNAAPVGTNTITVPSDGGPDSEVNNLSAGDTVVIGGAVYTISSVVDNGTTVSIALSTNLTTAVNAGDPILEQQSFQMTVANVGNVTGSPSTVDVQTTATSATDAAQTSSDTVTITVTDVLFEKFVTNETNPNGAGPTGIDWDGDTVADQDFYTTAGSVTAESGDTLRYAIRVTAPAGTTLTGVQFSDSIPSFTTYVAGSTELNGTAIADAAGPASPLVAGMDVNSPGEPVGTVNPNESAVVTFRVTVD